MNPYNPIQQTWDAQTDEQVSKIKQLIEEDAAERERHMQSLKGALEPSTQIVGGVGQSGGLSMAFAQPTGII